MTKFFPFILGFLVFATPANAALLVMYDFNSGNAKASSVAGGLTAFDFNQTGITAGIASSATPNFGTNASGIYNGNPAQNLTAGSTYVSYGVNTTSGRFEAKLNGSMSNTNALDASGTNDRTFALVRVTNNTPYRFNLASFSYNLLNDSPNSGTSNGGATTGTPTIVEQTQFRVVNSSTQNTQAYGNTSTGTNVTRTNSAAVLNRSLGVTLLSGESIEIRVALRRVGTAGARTFSIDNFRIDGDVVPEPASMAIFGGLAALGIVRRARRK